MVDWEVTETTTYCDAVGTNVTLIIRNDRSTRCTGNRKYCEELTRERLKEMRARGERLGKKLSCEGLQCERLDKYRKKLFCSE